MRLSSGELTSVMAYEISPIKNCNPLIMNMIVRMRLFAEMFASIGNRNNLLGEHGTILIKLLTFLRDEAHSNDDKPD
jgi:hypothetical protein